MTFRNVIAIDDDSLAGEAIKMVFSKKGISVDFFDSPKKAILHIKEHPRKYKMAIYSGTEQMGYIFFAAIAS